MSNETEEQVTSAIAIGKSEDETAGLGFTLFLGIDLLQVVEVHAAEVIAGGKFDGQPITGYNRGPLPQWFHDNHESKSAMKVKVTIDTRGSTDYVWIGVEDEYGNVSWAGPGDYIVKINDYHWAVLPEAFLKRFKTDPEI